MSTNGCSFNNYAAIILAELGYNVVQGDGQQGIGGIIDFKSGKPLSCEHTMITDLNEYEYISVSNYLDKGVKADLYQGSNGEKIYVDELGNTIIYLNDDDLKVTIFKSSNNSFQRISINYDRNKEDGDNSITFQYGDNDSEIHFDNSIDVFNNNSLKSIVELSAGKSKWGYLTDNYSANECTSDKILEVIIKYLREEDIYTEGLKRGISVISPALYVYARNFKNDWIACLYQLIGDKSATINYLSDQISSIQEQIEDCTADINSYQSVIRNLGVHDIANIKKHKS